MISRLAEVWELPENEAFQKLRPFWDILHWPHREFRDLANDLRGGVLSDSSTETVLAHL